jgi:GNAT superfamily N-acetyltransferase
VKIDVEPATLDQIASWREPYRREMNCQIVHDSWHERGFLRSYWISVDGRVVGYGSVGAAPDEPSDCVKEFWLERPYRTHAQPLFLALAGASDAKRIESQTSDRLLTHVLLENARDVERTRILFEDVLTTEHTVAGARFRPISPLERDGIFGHTHVPVGDWVIEVDGSLVATGGLMLHYNPPYSDIYMEVMPESRGRGLGSFLVQEVKRVAYEMGRTPAARCRVDNVASRRTLQRAGMAPCAWVLRGTLGGGPS